MRYVPGILADDMGLGKTLEIIALILTNFEGGKPLAIPVPGRVRASRVMWLLYNTVQLNHLYTESEGISVTITP